MITAIPHEQMKAFDHEHIQMLYNVISVLTSKLGGSVEITSSELRNPPEVIISKTLDASNVELIKLEEAKR